MLHFRENFIQVEVLEINEGAKTPLALPLPTTLYQLVSIHFFPNKNETNHTQNSKLQTWRINHFLDKSVTQCKKPHYGRSLQVSGDTPINAKVTAVQSFENLYICIAAGMLVGKRMPPAHFPI